MVTNRIRFHLDENVHAGVARGLRRYGIDVTTAGEAGLRMADDVAHADFARADERVIVTHDADFLRLARTTTDHCGIAYSAENARSVGRLIDSLVLIYEVLTPDEMVGRVEFL